ncbi:hypothetical protein, partial [Bartonella doshiae]
TGHASQDTLHRTRFTGHASQDTLHRTRFTGHASLTNNASQTIRAPQVISPLWQNAQFRLSHYGTSLD